MSNFCLLIWGFLALSCGNGEVRGFSEPSPEQESLSLLKEQCAKQSRPNCLEQQYLISVINTEREHLSMPLLVSNSRLDQVSDNWACELNKSSTFEHGAWDKRQIDAGFLHPMGENILRLEGESIDLDRARRAAYLWRHSPSHYRQWVNPKSRQIGTGVCTSFGRTTFVHDFTAL